MPCISVLIPVYNAGKYLPQCLQSLQQQTFVDFEIICIDDGSTDNSCQLIKKAQKNDPRLRLLSQKNSGVGVARNKLVKAARGKYICFVDADDWLESNALEMLYKEAVKQEADIVRGLFKEYDIDNGKFVNCDKKYSDYGRHKRPPFSQEERFQAGIDDSQVWGKLILSRLLRENNLYFVEGKYLEDVSFEILLYLSASKICFLDKYLYYYRTGNRESVSADKAKMARGILENWIFLAEEMEQRGWNSPDLSKKIISLILHALRRLRKFSLEKRDSFLCQKARVLIRKYKDNCFFWQYWKYSLFLRITDNCPTTAVIFWSRFFR